MEPAQIQPSSEEHIVFCNATYSIYPDRRSAINSGPLLGSTAVCTETGPYAPQELVFGRSPVSTTVDARHAVCVDELKDEDTLWAIPIQETILLHYQDELV